MLQALGGVCTVRLKPFKNDTFLSKTEELVRTMFGREVKLK